MGSVYSTYYMVCTYLLAVLGTAQVAWYAILVCCLLYTYQVYVWYCMDTPVVHEGGCMRMRTHIIYAYALVSRLGTVGTVGRYVYSIPGHGP